MGISLSLKKQIVHDSNNLSPFFARLLEKVYFRSMQTFISKGKKTCFASLGWVSNFVCLTFYSTHQSLQLLTAHIKD